MPFWSRVVLASSSVVALFLQGCGGGGGGGGGGETDLPSSFSCGTDDGCHVDTECHVHADEVHVHFEAHSCPGEAADPEGTCEEVAADLALADSCMKATACCSAVNDTSNEACVRSAACQLKVVV